MLEEKILNQIKSQNMNNAFIMIYFFDKVVIGKYENSQLFIPVSYDEELFDEIHIFNKDLEIRWNKDHEKVSVIKDTNDYFTEEMYLIGNSSDIKDGYTVVKQYGREMILPFGYKIENAKHDLVLVVHNLFSDTENYIDGYRLVDIKGGSLNG